MCQNKIITRTHTPEEYSSPRSKTAIVLSKYDYTHSLRQKHTPSHLTFLLQSCYSENKDWKYHWSRGGQSAANLNKSWNWNMAGRERSRRQWERRGPTSRYRFGVLPEGTLTRFMAAVEAYVTVPATFRHPALNGGEGKHLRHVVSLTIQVLIVEEAA